MKKITSVLAVAVWVGDFTDHWTHQNYSGMNGSMKK